ncbi:PepSY domain-containing protein [Streptomyces lichenis]|uniref:PepSY domain-containing protein n=1 Tax=Streptomyces lichenis TaxID=2306967 RepID=A0ABT0I877_9ACTN|nr:PepSY domain-containing protein [Streptomyces lichenis]MCK8677492.1 PepSY domain-containing protein [Streptomyces lichenis]
MKRNLVIATVTAALLAGGTATAFAVADGADQGPAKTAQSAPKVTAEQALKAVADRGQVVSLDLDDDGGKQAWDVELLKDGKVQDWTVDATTAKATQDKADADDANDND